MNNIYLLLIGALVIIGAYFGYDYYTKKMMTPSSDEMVMLEEELLSDEEFERVLAEVSNSSYFVEGKNEPLSVDFYYNENNVEAAIVSVATMSSMEGGEDIIENCMFNKVNNNWTNIQCFENDVTCEAMDKAGIDRQTTIDNYCVQADGNIREN